MNKLINLAPETKGDIIELSRSAIELVLNGDTCPLELLNRVKAIELLCKEITSSEQFKKAVLKEAERYGEKSFRFRSSKVEIKEVGTKYDFSISENWRVLNNELSEIKEKMKLVEAGLKRASQRAPYVDIVSGEEIYGCPKSSTTSVVITIDK